MRSPTPFSSSQSMARAFAVTMSRPLRKPLLILTPSPEYAPPPFGVPVLRRLHGAHDRQLMLGSEGPVALVLGRHGHDRPGPVPHQDVVGHVERDGIAGEGVDDMASRKGATLPQCRGVALGHALDVGGGGGPAAQRVDRLPLVRRGHLVHERVLGSHDGIGHAEAGVGPGREDPDSEPVASPRRRGRTPRPRTARSSCAASSSPARATRGRRGPPGARRRTG